jgi:manganese transport protein
MAGQVIMQDFVAMRIPLWVRRLVTIVPTIVVVACAVDVTRALIISQVVLSLVLPVPLITLVLFTSSRSVMGVLTTSWLTRGAAIGAALLVLALNGLVLLEMLI